jgi:hypothetical protein
MSKFVSGTYIVMRNSLGCEGDRTFVPDPKQGRGFEQEKSDRLKQELIHMIRDSVVLPGDSFSLIEGESER